MAIEPMAGDTDHVTPELPVPLTVALNWAICPDASEAEDGETDTEIGPAALGCSTTAALAVLVGSAVLVAIRVTVVCVLTDAGAEYMPLEMDPMLGTRDQETEGLSPPVVLTVNKAFCNGSMEIDVGVSDMLVGLTGEDGVDGRAAGVPPGELPTRKIGTLLVRLGFARLVAVSVTVCEKGMLLGGV